MMEVSGVRTISAPYEKVPVFILGGRIIPIRERIRRSSALMHEDPITLIVAPDKEGKASGSLYLDDGKSFEYQSGAKLYMQFTYDNGKLESKMLTPPGSYTTQVWLYKVVILGIRNIDSLWRIRNQCGHQLQPWRQVFGHQKTWSQPSAGVGNCFIRTDLNFKHRMIHS